MNRPAALGECTYEIAYHGACGGRAINLTEDRCRRHLNEGCRSCECRAVHECHHCGWGLCQFCSHNNGGGHYVKTSHECNTEESQMGTENIKNPQAPASEVLPRKGDWVKVWGQVKVPSGNPGVHPEDHIVEFFSHSEQFDCHVRADRVETVEGVPDFVERCTHLISFDEDAETLYRCTRHHDHGGEHQANDGKITWGSDFTDGYIEEK